MQQAQGAQQGARRRCAVAADRLKSSTDWNERVSALVELAAGGAQALPYASSVAAKLSDVHPKVCLAAARTLKTLGEGASAPHARQLAVLAVKHSHREVREAAGEALRSIPTSILRLPEIEQQTPLDVTLESSESARSSSSDQEDLPRHLRPQFWGVTVQQLADFRNELFDSENPSNLVEYCKAHKFAFIDGTCMHVCLNQPCPYGDHAQVSRMPVGAAGGIDLQPLVPNMHAVVAREIKPRTRPHGCSFARVLNPGCLEITAFVTHTWEERFDHFVGTLEMALRPDDVVWVCSCALDQNADISQLLHSDDLLRSPFAQALRHAPRLVVTLDEQLKVPERSWCAFELEKASQWSIPTFMWPYHLTSFKDLEEKVNSLDIRRASATSKADQERIHKMIQEGIGYDKMNQRLRAFLSDRLRFYEAAVAIHAGQLAALTRDIEEAKRENDTARLAALEAQREQRQRAMQVDVERAAEDASRRAVGTDAAEMPMPAVGTDVGTQTAEDARRQVIGTTVETQTTGTSRRDVGIDAAQFSDRAQEEFERLQEQLEQLEREFEEVCRERDQAANSMRLAQAEAEDLAFQLRRAREREASPAPAPPSPAKQVTWTHPVPSVQTPAIRVVSSRPVVGPAFGTQPLRRLSGQGQQLAFPAEPAARFPAEPMAFLAEPAARFPAEPMAFPAEPIARFPAEPIARFPAEPGAFPTEPVARPF